MVFAAAAASSPLARAVIDEGGRSLAALVEQLAARGVPVDDVVIAGSTILAQPGLYDAFAAALADSVPGHSHGPWKCRRWRGPWRSRVHSCDIPRTPGHPGSDTTRP